MEAGRRVIFREGIWNTTTRKIAEEAGISLATIHYYFANKDELLVAVYHEMISSIRDASAEDFAAPGTLTERIEGVIDRTWQFSEKNMDGQLMQAELTVYALRNGMRALAVRQGQEYLDIYTRVLESASDVVGRTDLDIEGLSRLVLAGIDGLLIAHTVEPDRARTASGFRNLAHVALHYPLTSGKKPLTPLTLPALKPERKRGRG
jgi:AcrR family transcriptional regulator